MAICRASVPFPLLSAKPIRGLKKIWSRSEERVGDSSLKFQFPIRFKIVLLILAALSVSLLSYIYVGTELIVQDKVSYIYDYALAEVKSASERFDSQLQRVGVLGRLIGNLVRVEPAPPPQFGPALPTASAEAASPAQAKSLYEQYAKDLGITGALILSATDEDHFKSELELGDGGAPGAAHYGVLLAQLGWIPKAFGKESMLIGTPIHGRIPLGIRTASSDGKPLVFFTLCKLDQALMQEGGKNYELRLMDGLGKTLLDKPAPEGQLAPAQFDAFAKTLTQATFDSGVRDWSSDGQDYIAGYQRLGSLGSKKLTVVSLISKRTAFAAAKQLATRSLALGLSILLLAVGFTLLVVRGMTGRLREMWQATRKVSEGDFSIRVSTLRLPRDEVGGLALSFNTMADKINSLMVQTAQKARMEKELETAQAVQSRFFPSHSFEHARLRLAGRYVPASECAGDWWHYAQVGNQLVVVVGDVTGHGVSAALVTAAAHSTFSLVIQQFKAHPRKGGLLETLVRSLNTAVCAAAAGQSTMTFVGSIIDLESGQMTTSNASHPPLYVYRKPEGQARSPMSCFKPIMDGRSAPLGDNARIEVASSTYQLQPGDRIFWYTDGIMESRPSDGEKMNKSAFLKLLAAQADATPDVAEPVCGGVMEETLSFFGKGSEDRPDDITLVVATIPAEATFQARAA